MYKTPCISQLIYASFSTKCLADSRGCLLTLDLLILHCIVVFARLTAPSYYRGITLFSVGKAVDFCFNCNLIPCWKGVITMPWFRMRNHAVSCFLLRSLDTTPRCRLPVYDTLWYYYHTTCTETNPWDFGKSLTSIPTDSLIVLSHSTPLAGSHYSDDNPL